MNNMTVKPSKFDQRGMGGFGPMGGMGGMMSILIFFFHFSLFFHFKWFVASHFSTSSPYPFYILPHASNQIFNSSFLSFYSSLSVFLCLCTFLTLILFRNGTYARNDANGRTKEILIEISEYISHAESKYLNSC